MKNLSFQKIFLGVALFYFRWAALLPSFKLFIGLESQFSYLFLTESVVIAESSCTFLGSGFGMGTRHLARQGQE